MATYEFILTFALPDPEADPSAFTDALFAAGCDDATVGVGKRGSIALEFDREAASAEAAIRSAMATVQRAVPGAELVEVKPDLVNLSDIADLIGCSRQNMRKYASGEIRTVKARFPAPISSGTASLWHLFEVATWLVRNTNLHPTPELIETAEIACGINLDTQRRRVERSRRFAHSG